jgi:hypothetical protein
MMIYEFAISLLSRFLGILFPLKSFRYKYPIFRVLETLIISIFERLFSSQLLEIWRSLKRYRFCKAENDLKNENNRYRFCKAENDDFKKRKYPLSFLSKLMLPILIKLTSSILKFDILLKINLRTPNPKKCKCILSIFYRIYTNRYVFFHINDCIYSRQIRLKFVILVDDQYM